MTATRKPKPRHPRHGASLDSFLKSEGVQLPTVPVRS
jgi:hypothetical protein